MRLESDARNLLAEEYDDIGACNTANDIRYKTMRVFETPVEDEEASQLNSREWQAVKEFLTDYKDEFLDDYAGKHLSPEEVIVFSDKLA